MKMKRIVRIFSMILSLLCVLTMIPVSTVSAASTGSIDLSEETDGIYTDENGTDYTIVSSFSELQSVSNTGKNVILDADIDYQGNDLEIKLNNVTFDGNGHTISGVKAAKDALCMFTASGTVVVKNLNIGSNAAKIKRTSSGNTTDAGLLFHSISGATVTVENVDVYAEIEFPNSGKATYFGIFFGRIKTGSNVTIKDCKFNGKVTETANGSVGGYVGAVAGTANLEIQNCVNQANISGNNVGGFVGLTAGTVQITVKNCVNQGNISGRSSLGGFFGLLNGESGTPSQKVTIEDCVNRGNVTASVDTETSVGGFVGQTTGIITVNILKSVNEGMVRGTFAAGALGHYNTKTVELKIENSLNTGYVEGSKIAAGMIGRMGYSNNGTSPITLNFATNVGKVHATGEGEASGLVHASTSQMSIIDCASFGTVTTEKTTQDGIIRATGWKLAALSGTRFIRINGSEDKVWCEAIERDDGFTIGVDTLADGVEWFNEQNLSNTLGKLIVGYYNETSEAYEGAVLAAPTFAGVQESTKEPGNIRLVATINDSLAYFAVGFKVELVGAKTITKGCNTVYNELTSTDEQGYESKVAATDLCGAYVFAVAVEGIPSTGSYTLIVTPYGTDLDTQTVYEGASVNVIYTNGKVVDITPCA